MRRPLWLVLPLLAALAIPAGAQKPPKEPKRPGIGGGDQSDPVAYYQWGVSQLERYPEDAADAFYWAIRLAPGWSDAYYARWVALHLSDPDRLVMYYYRDSKTLRSAEVRQIDSLRLHAMELNPYLYRKFERVMEQHFLEQNVKRRYPNIDQAALADAVREMTSKGDAGTKAVNAYIAGNFPYALQEWAADLPSWKNKSYPHAERGRIFYMLGSYDSATAELTTAMKEMRKDDKNDLVFVYESKALYEQSLGMIDEKQGNIDAAREAYGRALQEDLSYAPAHLALSAMNLAKQDSVAAISEMDIASQVAPSDGFIAFLYGRTLLLAGHDAESLEQLKRAVKLEPYFAEPHVFLAAIYDNSGYIPEAVSEYTTFVKLASEKDARVEKARARLARLAADSVAAAAGPAAAPPAPAAPPKPPKS